MITKNDCILLLTDISKRGVDTSEEMKRIISSKEVSIETIKFINSNRQLDLDRFYNQLRKNYNNKKSKLYINIVREIEDTNNVLTTLSALLTQILLFSRNCDDREMFLKHSRADEISKALTKYFIDYDLSICINLLRLIKLDLKAIEMIR